MTKQNWRSWLKAASIRAIKTAAEAAISLIGGGAMGILDVDWVSVASVSAMSAIVSLLFSIKGLPEVQE